MCLEISSHYHRKGGVKTATFPILVWKGLNKSYDKKGLWVSPYHQYEYTFGKVYYAILQRSYNEIYHGLHACITKDRAEYHSDISRAFPAIVPVGSQFWLSRAEDNEIVSDSLIVFREMPQLRDHFGGVEIAPPVKRNTL